MVEKVSYTLTDKEAEKFLSADYGLDSKSAHRKVGNKIVETINSFEINKKRECFYAERVKDQVIKSLAAEESYGKSIRFAVGSNYFHYSIKREIKLFLLYRKFPHLSE